VSDDVQKPRPWDLDQYSVRNRQAAQDAARELEERRAANAWREERSPVAPGIAAPDEGGDGEPPRGALDDDGFYLEPGEAKLRARYVDDGSLFWVALSSALLTVVTAGLYRFWMITRLRRTYTGSIRIDGDPIEYTGTGFEKIIGFLIAVTVLAVYLGLANIALVFVGIVSLDADSLFVPFSLVAVVPFLFWAAYRSQRYMMARLRWRGIRFGLEPGSWGYMLRSLLWGVAVLATAGLLWPFMHFRQAKYIADRSFFGDLRFTQEGSWLGLMSYWIWLYIAGAMFFLFGWGIAEEMELGADGIGVMVFIIAPFAFVTMFLLFMNYQVGAFRYLWDNRTVGHTRLNNDLSTRAVVWTYIKGSFMVSFLTSLVIMIVGIVSFGVLFSLGLAEMGEGLAIGQPGEEPDLAQMMQFLPVIIGVGVVYLMAFAVSYAFTQAFIVRPILKLRVEGMLLRNPSALRYAAQRRHDSAAEAGGFADALGVDMGAGFG
jgi:uncharacterized membrane protein YjgN (DUF898 family)